MGNIRSPPAPFSPSHHVLTNWIASIVVTTFLGISQNPAHPNCIVCIFADICNYSTIHWNFQIATGDSYRAFSLSGCNSVFKVLLKAAREHCRVIHGMSAMPCLLQYWKPMGLGIYVRKMVSNFVTALHFCGWREQKILLSKTFPAENLLRWPSVPPLLTR